MAYIIGISTESNSWSKDWDDIPFSVAVRVADEGSLLPQREVTVRLEVPKNNGVWVGGSSNTIELETDQLGVATAKVKFAKGAPQVVTLTASKIETDGSVSASRETYIVMVSSTLRNHTFPLASDGYLTEADVNAGVYAIVPVDRPEIGNVVSFHFGDNDIIKTSQTSSTVNTLPVSIPDSYMTSGDHQTGYYITDGAGNSNFSDVVKVNVIRDDVSSTIVDLPPVSVPRADNNNTVINVALATIGIEIHLDGLYEGNLVNTIAVENSICNIYWKSFRGTQAVPNASRVFSVMVDTEDNNPIIIDDNYQNEGNAIRDLLYALGEGTVKISYEVRLQEDSLLHASPEKSYYVDVVPPTKSSVDM